MAQLDSDPIFAALTRPQMIAGVTYPFAVFNLVLSVEAFESMLAAQPLATGMTIEGSGHLLPLDRPIALADALEGFLHEEALDAEIIGEAREALEIP